MKNFKFLIFCLVNIVWVNCMSQENADPKVDNIFFICYPSNYVHQSFLEDAEKANCATIQIVNDETEEACGKFRKDLSALSARGGFYHLDNPGDGNRMAESFSLSRSTGIFEYSLTGELSSKTWQGRCYRHTEKFRY
jgi:hypothetical protein